jgi:hypothetical protein
MPAHIKTLANVGVLALGWLATLLGCLIIAGALSALFFLLVRGVSPGQPMFLDVSAPTVGGALLHLANGITLTSAPFLLRWAIRRWRQSRPRGTGDKRLPK